MRFGGVVPVLNEFRFLPAVLGQLLKICDRVVLVRSVRAFSGAAVTLKPLPGLDARIERIEGAWPDDGAARNAGIEVLSDCDYVFTLDSDEILLESDFYYLQNLCRRATHQALAMRLLTYWKSPDYRIDPPEILVAPVVLRQDVRYLLGRRLRDGVCDLVASRYIHHLSYVHTDEEMREKLRHFMHAGEIRRGWFEGVWKRWDENHDLENLHPTHPASYRRAIRAPDPELRRVLAEFGCA